MSSSTLEEYYPAIAIATLMRIIRDPTLFQHHTMVVQVSISPSLIQGCLLQTLDLKIELLLFSADLIGYFKSITSVVVFCSDLLPLIVIWKKSTIHSATIDV